MTLASGTRLGPYEVTGAIGAGGMGEVSRARDTKLNHPNVAQVCGFEGAALPDGTSAHFLAMELVEDVLASQLSEGYARLSPDDRWIAYVSDEPGHPEVYVQPYPSLSTRAETLKRLAQH